LRGTSRARLAPDIIRRTNAANHLENAWAKFERAEVDIEAFDALFATESRALGAEVRGKMCCRCSRATCGPKWSRRSMRVKAKFKTGCITKTFPPMRSESASGRSLYIAEVMVLFDTCISREDRAAKTRSRIYQI